MSIPQRQKNESEESFPTLVEPGSGAKRQLGGPGDDYDPEAAVALLRQFMDKPSEDPETNWAEILAFAWTIDEDRGSGRKLFEKHLTE